MQVLESFNATEKQLAPEHTDRTMAQIFETWAAQTPDARCLVYEGQQLSYAEVNARANQLAHHMIEMGVTPDSCVGVMMERSLGDNSLSSMHAAACISSMLARQGLPCEPSVVAASSSGQRAACAS